MNVAYTYCESMPSLIRHTDLSAELPTPVRSWLTRATAIAHAQGAALWLVGGVVRDLLLGLEVTRDLDLAVEGDAIALAHALAGELDGEITATHAAFGTATVTLKSASLVQLDLASTRTETYPHPAALPVVQPASITQDLLRRDFSINAMALKLKVTGGNLASTSFLDPCGGKRDLEAGLLRVLHDRSFDDDPIRILRGLRLAVRLDLQLDPHTHTLLDAALARGRLEATTPDRIRTELCLALDEPEPDAVLRLADTWKVTPHIFAPLHWNANLATRCTRARILSLRHTPHNPLVYAGLLTYDLPPPERAYLITRYRLPGDATRVLREVGQLQALRDRLTSDLRNSELERLLRPFGETALTVVRYAELPPVCDAIAHYLANLRQITPALNGYALQQLGVPPGPQLGALLQELRAARLDGLVATRSDEEAWVRRKLAMDG